MRISALPLLQKGGEEDLGEKQQGGKCLGWLVVWGAVGTRSRYVPEAAGEEKSMLWEGMQRPEQVFCIINTCMCLNASITTGPCSVFWEFQLNPFISWTTGWVPLSLSFVLTDAQAQDHWFQLIPDTSVLVLHSGQGLSKNFLTDKASNRAGSCPEIPKIMAILGSGKTA